MAVDPNTSQLHRPIRARTRTSTGLTEIYTVKCTKIPVDLQPHLLVWMIIYTTYQLVKQFMNQLPVITDIKQHT